MNIEWVAGGFIVLLLAACIIAALPSNQKISEESEPCDEERY